MRRQTFGGFRRRAGRRGFRLRATSSGGWTLAETAVVVALAGVVVGVFVDGMAEWLVQYRRLLAARHCRQALAVFREGARTPQVAERLTRGGTVWELPLGRCRLAVRPVPGTPGRYELGLHSVAPGRLPFLRPVRADYTISE